MRNKSIKVYLLAFAVTISIVAGCSKEDDSKGIGPVKEDIVLGAIDNNLAANGQKIFEAKCTLCHKIDQKFLGPPLANVTKTQKPEWIMNMILNPVEMTQKNPEAMRLFREYGTQMTFQDVSKDDARAILEYLRTQEK